MKKIAIYARTSKRDMHPENQLIRLRAYADSQHWQYDIFEEQESTRKTRPVKAEVVRQLRNGTYDGILVYKLDRYARSTTELLLEIDEFVKKGIEFHSLSEGFHFDRTPSPINKFFLTVLSGFSEFEREIIRERTIEGLERAKRQGKKAGRPRGSKDKKKRRTDGYFKNHGVKTNNPPLNNSGDISSAA